VSEGSGQQQRYCTNCGAEIRPGNSFCVSCGQRLDAVEEDRATEKEEGRATENTNPLKKFYEETQTRYREWSEAQAAQRERNEVLRVIQRERDARRVRFDRYLKFFERARSGAQTSLEWRQAYDEDEEPGEEGQSIDELLTSAQERAEAGLVKMRGFEEAFVRLLQADSFGEADEFLDRMLAGQEDFEGEQSVFPPLVAVHERIKHSEDWANYRRELEQFIKDLEDLLDSPAVRTAPANRARFPEPGQEHPPHPEVSFPHEPTLEADVPPLPDETTGPSIQQSKPSTEEVSRTDMLQKPGTVRNSDTVTSESSSVTPEWWERFRDWWRQATMWERWFVVALAGVMLYFLVFPLLQGGIDSIRSSSYTVTSEQGASNQPGTSAVIMAQTESDELNDVAKAIVRDYRDDGYDSVWIILESSTSDVSLYITASYSLVGEAQTGVPAGRFEVSRFAGT
jgi:hypothetical protein